jgi:hypothetical protein
MTCLVNPEDGIRRVLDGPVDQVQKLFVGDGIFHFKVLFGCFLASLAFTQSENVPRPNSLSIFRRFLLDAN